ncbi:DUF1040 family protein [Sansalvadorimonas verongulae]|uniref:DUF1040 family protein n=1 Tax=Sansalvadorimonas verongulae TaxID=2172824 RepID=UPI0012BB8F53|nr:DUF1040 family protein [Sansalvadorimonas verongulae]MTI12517.1 DUF1040 family protein [Sansalvadorimonas verongulae]
MTESKKELLELLLKAWEKEPELDLMRVVEHVAASAGHLGSVSNLSDDVLFYQLDKNMSGCQPRLGGVHTEYVPDFRSALMEARGCKA